MYRLFGLAILVSFVSLTSIVRGGEEKKKPREHPIPWSFHSPKRPPPPKVENAAWVRNPIDAFVLAKLEAKGLKPSPPASPVQLIRRVTFDLTGLPPTPQEIEKFLEESEAKPRAAYENLVDRLLNSPRYGERWAMYWLDLVRFAESDGFRADGFRPTAWRYRDYVIKSFNDDKPYDRFIREQIAGDELYPNDPQAIVATAFNRHFPDEHNARNLDQRRQEILNDITDVTAQVFLGLTFGCAQCHDHRYDPISQKDYYRFQAFFAAFSYRDNLPMAGAKKRQQYAKQLQQWKEKTAQIRLQLEKFEAPFRRKLMNTEKSKFPRFVQVAYDLPYQKRTPFQKQIAEMFGRQMVVGRDKLEKAIKKDARKKWDKLRAELKKFDRIKPKPLPVTMGITDIGTTPPPTHFLNRGNFRKPGDKLQPGFPEKIDGGGRTPILPKTEIKQIAAGLESRRHIPRLNANIRTTGRRAVLAKWLSSPKNPLTARVMVNRLWQHHFGHGIAGTTSDLGNEGQKPTHPQLLDWLAVEFMRPSPPAAAGGSRSWSLKHMHRLMVTSNTYRQSSRRSQSGEKTDPQNKLLWRMNLRRLEGEALRDGMLAVSGQLNLKMGGPSIHPQLPKAVTGGWKASKDPKERNRRSVYVFLKRNLRYPMFSAFDAPDSNESCSRRHISTNAPQALTLLNGEFSLQSAKAFAARVLKETDGKAESVIRRAYRVALGRTPDDREMSLGQQFLQEQAKLIRHRSAKEIALPTNVPDGVTREFAAAAVEYCHVVMNLNEFLYID